MNKKQLTNAISIRTGYTQEEISEILDTGLEILKERMLLGDHLTLCRFGTFEPVIRPAQKKRWHDINSGKIKEADVPEKIFVKFKLSPHYFSRENSIKEVTNGATND